MDAAQLGPRRSPCLSSGGSEVCAPRRNHARAAGQSSFGPTPWATYGAALLLAAIAHYILAQTLIRTRPGAGTGGRSRPRHQGENLADPVSRRHPHCAGGSSPVRRHPRRRRRHLDRAGSPHGARAEPLIEPVTGSGRSAPGRTNRRGDPEELSLPGNSAQGVASRVLHRHIGEGGGQVGRDEDVPHSGGSHDPAAAWTARPRALTWPC